MPRRHDAQNRFEQRIIGFGDFLSFQSRAAKLMEATTSSIEAIIEIEAQMAVFPELWKEFGLVCSAGFTVAIDSVREK